MKLIKLNLISDLIQNWSDLKLIWFETDLTQTELNWTDSNSIWLKLKCQLSQYPVIVEGCNAAH